MKYLEGLNQPQQQAVLHTEGPLMIIAGAGSGKTRVLTNRIAHLINHGIDAFQILALTFTNKAAGEMRQRIEKLVGTEAKNLWMGTFHSIFARILRIEAEKINYTSNFSIYDSEDSKSLLKTLIKEINLDDQVYKPAGVLNRISGAKNRLISAQEYRDDLIQVEDDRASGRPEVGRIYELYQQRLRKANAMDFDDLLFNTNLLLANHPVVLHKYQKKFQYILIDEFQDTNFSQYEIVRKLSGLHRNICVVGDDAQSIYAFRGADIKNILNFEKDYRDLTVIRLEQNYRSTENIVNAANTLIANNLAQLKKKVWTENEQGSLIRILRALSDTEEGRMVADSIFEEKMNNGWRNSDFAILYRTNAQSRIFEDSLRKKNIKYRVVGGLSFYQRREIKDLIAYLRFTINHNDEEALKRIINLPKRGIGETTVSHLLAAALQNAMPVWEVMKNARSFLSSKVGQGIEAFAQLIQNFEALMQTLDAYTVASAVAKDSGLLKDLYEDKTIEGLSRYENVQELLNAIKEFVDNPENQDKSLGAFLQEVSLLTSIDEATDDNEERVTLMTIHAAKGLEFKKVFVVGMEEDLFPSRMMLNSRVELEEERRLFYVAMTRAEKKLTLSYAHTRYIHGKLQSCEPSRFLMEIDKNYLKFDNSFTKLSEYNPSTSFVNNLKVKYKPLKPNVSVKVNENFVPSDTSNLKAGMTVEHVKFGQGVVKEVQVYSNDKKALIEFAGIGEKTLLLSFAKLKILN